MTNKRPKPEEIVSKLRKVEVLMGQVTPAKFFFFFFKVSPIAAQRLL